MCVPRPETGIDPMQRLISLQMAMREAGARGFNASYEGDDEAAASYWAQEDALRRQLQELEDELGIVPEPYE